MRGKFIVFEGPDGSGKTTQTKLLYSYLKKKKVPAAYISFPRYTDSNWGALVRKYLDGEFGKLDSYLASMLYAGDRFSAAGEIRKWLELGKVVVCDRYVASSIGHQTAKIKNKKDQDKFISWLENLEYKENGIPHEDLVVFLSIPVSFSQKLMKSRKLDIHEKDKSHLESALAVYEGIARTRKYWTRVDNVEKGKLLTPEEVHLRVIEVLKKKKFI